LLTWASPDLDIEVECSKGTYIRSLAHEVGQRLGCGGHLAALTRTASGPFRLSEAVSLERLAEAFARGEGAQLLLPTDAALQDIPAAIVDEATAAAISFGQRVTLQVQTPAPLCRGYTTDGHLLALLKHEQEGLWRPYKVFPRRSGTGYTKVERTCR
jgi:tRNA pseudouridine55 synthase